MSLFEELHIARKARLDRFSAAAIRPPVAAPVIVPPKVVAPIKPRAWPPVPFKSRPIAHVQSLCCMYFNVPKFDLISPGRTKDLVYPRQIAMYLSKTWAFRSFPEIGRRFGGCDHSTALHAVHKIARLIRTDWTVAYDVARIEAIL